MPERTTRWLLAVLLLVAMSIASPAQVYSEGAILGLVKDPTGAVIPGARIAAVHLDTGLQKTAATDESGNFEILALPIGAYSVTVSATGFKTWNLAKTEITVGARSRLEPVLEVGDVSEQVSVEATVELIQTDKSSVEGVVQQRQIRDLPLNGRNPVQLVNLVPGMRFLGRGNVERISTVQGFGARDDQTEFQMDGLNANAGMDEGGMGIPNVDTIAEFNVQTSSFSAENGRNPIQVMLVLKSGGNEFHGTAWEFLRNDKLDARHTFATRKPVLRRNQFGFTAGGPVVRNKTFFFGSIEGTTIRQQSIYNSTVVQPDMLKGNFSSLAKALKDPTTGQAFPGNQIPESRFPAASKYFFPYILLPNSPDGRFRAIASNIDDTYEYTGRVDHQVTAKQRIYGRWVIVDVKQDSPAYKPDVIQNRTIFQHNAGGNYTYTLTPTTLLTGGLGYLRSDNKFTSPLVGKENEVAKAGIRGIPTEGREEAIGIPNVGFTGYTGFSLPWGVPGRLWSWALDTKLSMNLIRGAHNIGYGYQFNNRTTYGTHASHSGRGTFDFNSQYTGDGFADYLLGLTSGTRRNYPIAPFGMSRSPYSGIYVQDFWRVHPSVTLNLGLRYDRWHAKSFKNGAGGSFDLKLGKAVAGEENGKVNLNSQPVAKYLAPATADLWVPASQAGMDGGLFKPDGYFSPRLGATWRPFGKNDFVVRGGYGMFMSSFRGNHTASSIVGLPFWTIEAQAYSSLTLQSWDTAWPQNPRDFVLPSVSEAPAYDAGATANHEWNLSIQKGLPFKSAITVSYLGARIYDQITLNPHNEVAPGRYPNLQAAKPWPRFGDVSLLENIGNSWYNGLQLKFERRFTEGLSYTLSYSFAKHIQEKTPASDWGRPAPFAPEGYHRGRSEFDRTHILAINTVYELPFGKGRKYMSSPHPVTNAILGGWQLTGIYYFTSGYPLSFSVPGATLGNGWGTRPNLVGNPKVSDPTTALWFNPAAFAAPPQYAWGNSGIGLVDGPGSHTLDAGLMKNFYFNEQRYIQFRWEMFNAPNHVNYGNPVTTFGLATTGKIFGAGSARQMQAGLKFIF